MIHLTRQERQVFLFVSFLVALGFLAHFLAASPGADACLRSLYSGAETRPLDVNRAGREELIALPLIGEKTADEILRLRRSEGNFTHLEDLKKIRGMTDAKLNKLKEYLCVGTEE